MRIKFFVAVTFIKQDFFAFCGKGAARFGIRFAASPRHADAVYLTGPVTENMRLALDKTYAAVSDPKFLIAAGACAISGGLYKAGPKPAEPSLFIPGCPPHPATTLEALLRFTGR